MAAAYEIPGFTRTSPAGADLTASQFRFVAMNSSEQAVVPAAGARVVGVRRNSPNTGEATTITTSGIVFVEAGAVLAVDDAVATDVAGKAVVATIGDAIVGRVVRAASADGVIASVELHTEQVLAL